MCRSVPQIDAACTRTRTSPSPGEGTGTSCSSAPRAFEVLRSARIEVIAGERTPEARRARGETYAGTVRGRLPSNAATPTDGGTDMRRTPFVIPILALMLLAASCGEKSNAGAGGSTGASGGAGAIGHPTGSDDLVLRMDVSGGFVPAEVTLKNVPGVSIFGDGRMIVTGPVIEIYPGPALPNLQVTRLTEEG